MLCSKCVVGLLITSLLMLAYEVSLLMPAYEVSLGVWGAQDLTGLDPLCVFACSRAGVQYSIQYAGRWQCARRVPADGHRHRRQLHCGQRAQPAGPGLAEPGAWR